MDITWRDITALLTVATLMGGMFIAWVRWRLGGEFASATAVAAIASRMDEMEIRMRAAPTHADIREVLDRMSRVETGVAVVGAEVRGIKESMGRVESATTMLLNHGLGRSAEGA